MRLHIVAVGRMKAGPEKALCDDYIACFVKQGRGLGFSALHVVEVDDRKGGGKEVQGDLILKAIPKNAALVCLDERGKALSSVEFGHQLSEFQDQGISDLAFVIGGADGISKDVLSRAAQRLSFGAMVWPHMLVRVMLAEQLYRAASILAGAPYHRA